MRIVAAAIAVALAVGATILIIDRPPAPGARACTPGPPLHPLEELAVADAIVVVDVVSVGDSQNRAPTVTPQVVSPPYAATRVGSPVPTPPATFDLAGYGATLRVIRGIVGSGAEFVEVDRAERRRIEESARHGGDVAGRTGFNGNCPISDPRIRYAPGARYIAFLRVDDMGTHTVGRYEIDGDAIIVGGNAPVYSEVAPLYMLTATHDRYFAGVPFNGYEGQQVGNVSTARVLLKPLLRAIAALRGDPSIAPPETGSAGLASGR